MHTGRLAVLEYPRWDDPDKNYCRAKIRDGQAETDRWGAWLRRGCPDDTELVTPSAYFEDWQITRALKNSAD